MANSKIFRIFASLNKKVIDMANLTLVGTKGLELTREEIIDLKFRVDAIERKAACREVNSDILTSLDRIASEINALDLEITDILEGNYEG